MKKKFSKILGVGLALVLALSLCLVTAVPVAAEDEGTNYSPFGTVLYIWGADGGDLANAMKWWYIGGDGAQWDGYQVTIVNSQWPEFDGQWYLKNTGAAERFTLWRDAALTDQVTTTNNGLIGSFEAPAAYAIDGWVEFDPEVDTVGDPRETVGNMSHMWYDHASCYGEGNLEVKFQSTVEHGFYDGWRLDLVECGWDDLNGTWFLEWVAEDGGTYADRYELYADAEFTQLGIPADPDKFVPYGGESGYLFGPRGRFVAPYEVWVDDDGSDTNPGTEDLPFATIQKGIGMVASGGMVNVLAGTYLKKIVINKALTVKSTDGAEDTIIQGISTSDYYLIDIQHSDVTFEGFTVTNPTTAFGSDVSGILVQYVSGEPVDNVHILNNIVTQVRSETGTPSMYGATGINIGNAPLSNIVISGNTITDIKNPDGASVDHTCGINVWDGAEGVVISNNTISDIKYNGIILEHASNVLIENNPIITGCETGIRVEPFDEGAVSDVTVNLNNFADNNIQVFDGAFEVLDIEDVLVDNIFDRAVVIDREGGSLLHIIWSSIQDGIDAAVTGDTVDVAAGTYDEVVAVNESVNLLGANDGVCAGVDPGTRGPETIIDGYINIQASNVVIDGIKLINGGDIEGSTSGIYMTDQSHITITNSILVGPAGSTTYLPNAMILGSYGGTATTHSEDINVTCCESYNWNMGAYANPGGGFSTDYLFQYNNFHDNSHCGLGLDVIGVSVLNNNFTNNSIGIEAFRDNTVVHWNNFCGNGVGIDFNTTTYGATFLDATNNWWCHPSGPTASPGSGDPVSSNVIYNPWLLEPVLPGEPLPTLFDKTLALNIGWTLVSTDNWIDPAESVGVNVVLAYNYTPSLSYFEVDPAALVPVNALYLKTEVGGALGITYSGGVPVASSKPLEAGWNLVSSATIDNAKDVLSPLRYIDVGDEQGFGLATLVSQGPPLNQHTESFYIATLGLGDWNNVLAGTILNPFDGYWVYMNAGKVFGVVPE